MNQELKQVIGCWYPDVAWSLEPVCIRIETVGGELSEQDLREVAELCEQAAPPALEPMDGTWLETVRIAYESVQIYTGEQPDRFVETFFPDETGLQATGSLVDAARDMRVACG